MYREFQARKALLIDIIFAMKKVSVDLFRAAHYMFLLPLHKDALFHKLVPYIVDHKHSNFDKPLAYYEFYTLRIRNVSIVQAPRGAFGPTVSFHSLRLLK
jgi:hypothetical protein